jgi:hypothetical protein
MNEGRSTWLNEARLIQQCTEFFESNGYKKLERDVMFDQGNHVFNSLLVGSKDDEEKGESIATYFAPRLDRYEIALFGSLESILFDILDNYEETNLMLVTDSMSYFPITKIEELGVAIENLMDEGMFLLFLNGRSGYAIFDEYAKLTKPIAVTD